MEGFRRLGPQFFICESISILVMYNKLLQIQCQYIDDESSQTASKNSSSALCLPKARLLQLSDATI